MQLYRKAVYRTCNQAGLFPLILALASMPCVLGCVSASTYSGKESLFEPTMKVIEFNTTEGTFLNIDVSPDGKRIAFDLLGDLYLLPVDGGEATPLTEGSAWDQAPRFSPDGKYVYFVSDRRGFKNIWQIGLDETSVRQVTKLSSDVVGTPNWSQSTGRLLAAIMDPVLGNIETRIFSIDVKTGRMEPVQDIAEPYIDINTYQRNRAMIQTYSAVQAPDGKIFFAEGRYEASVEGMVVQLYTINESGGARARITKNDSTYDEYKPMLSHDGKLLAYFRQYEDRRTEIRLLNRATGEGRAIVGLSNEIEDDASFGAIQALRPNYAFTPDNKSLIAWIGGKLKKLSIVDGRSEEIPFHVRVTREVRERVIPPPTTISDDGIAKIIRWPSVSPDGRNLAFSANGHVWIMARANNQYRRLTDAADLEYMPAFSPDGSSIAYISFPRVGRNFGPARVMIADTSSGACRELLSDGDRSETFLLPTWSPEGDKIALMREFKAKDGGPLGWLTEFGWTWADQGEFQKVAGAPRPSQIANLFIDTRYVGFSASGKRLIFGFPSSRKHSTLESAELDGTDRKKIISGSHVSAIHPSPNLNHVVMTANDGSLWGLNIDGRDLPISVDTKFPGAYPIHSGTGYYVNWRSNEDLTFSFADRLSYCSGECQHTESHQIHVKFQKPKSDVTFAITGARLISFSETFGDNHIIGQGTVLVTGSRILAVGSADAISIPNEAVAIDASGYTIIPGLIDTHYHRIGGTGGPGAGLA